MNSAAGNYTKADAKESLSVLRTVPEQVVDAIEEAADASVLEFLIREQQLDLHHEGDQGIGIIGQAVPAPSVGR